MKWKDAVGTNYTFLVRGYIDDDGEYVVVTTSTDNPKTKIGIFKGDTPDRRSIISTKDYGVEKYNDWLPLNAKEFLLRDYVPDEQAVKLCYFRYKKLLKKMDKT